MGLHVQAYKAISKAHLQFPNPSKLRTLVLALGEVYLHSKFGLPLNLSHIKYCQFTASDFCILITFNNLSITNTLDDLDLEQLDRPMDGFEKEKIMLLAILSFTFLKSEKNAF